MSKDRLHVRARHLKLRSLEVWKNTGEVAMPTRIEGCSAPLRGRGHRARIPMLVIAAVSMLFAASGVRAASVSLPVNASGSPGQSVDVPLSVSPMNGVLAADFDVAYDASVVHAVSVAKTSLTQSLLLTYNLDSAGWAYISLYGTQAVTGSGPAVTITFQTIQPGCTFLDITRADLNEGDIAAVIQDGALSVCDPVDRDGDSLSECAGDCSDRFSSIRPGAAESCNGADDDCDGSIDEGVSCPCGAYVKPRGAGFWQTICLGTTLEGTIAPAYAGIVNDTVTFRAISSTAELCSVLTVQPSSPPCKSGEIQFMALLLDVASGRLCQAQPISASWTSATTVGGAVSEVDALLANPSRSAADCLRAAAVSSEIGDGRAIPGFLGEEVSISATKEASGRIQLGWPEPDAAAAGRPMVYKVYRTGAPAPFTWTLLASSMCHRRFVGLEPGSAPHAASPLPGGGRDPMN